METINYFRKNMHLNYTKQQNDFKDPKIIRSAIYMNYLID